MQDRKDIFISYGRGNENSLGSKEFTYKLHDALKNKDFLVWLDKDEIPFATDFQAEINEGIRRADNFVFIISPHSINSRYCLLEVELAVMLNKRIIPILHIMPNSQEMEESMHPDIARLNWLPFQNEADFAESLQKLIAVVESDREHVSTHTHYSQKALDWTAQHRSNDWLLRGKELKTAEIWLEKNNKKQPLPTKLQKEFIAKSRKNANYVFWRNTLFLSVFVVISALSVLTIWFAKEEIREKELALINLRRAYSNKLSSQANMEHCDKMDQSLRLAELAFYADTTNEMARCAFWNTFYQHFSYYQETEGSFANPDTIISNAQYKAVFSEQKIKLLNKEGELLCLIDNKEKIKGFRFKDDQTIEICTEKNKIRSYSLDMNALLKQLDQKQVRHLTTEEVKEYGIDSTFNNKVEIMTNPQTMNSLEKDSVFLTKKTAENTEKTSENNRKTAEIVEKTVKEKPKEIAKTETVEIPKVDSNEEKELKKSWLKANNFLKKDNFEMGLKELEKSIAKNNGQAFHLKAIYFHGGNLKENDFKSIIKFYQQAIEFGDSTAFFGLGLIYYRGDGVLKNAKKSEEYFAKSFEYCTKNANSEGWWLAQYDLGYLYENKHYVKLDLEKALFWYKKAAEQGHSVSQFKVALFNEQGKGTSNSKRNLNEAFVWYKKAAEGGLGAAQLKLGYFYENAFGTEKDFSQAKIWYKKAEIQGIKEATQALKRLKAKQAEGEN